MSASADIASLLRAMQQAQSRAYAAAQAALDQAGEHVLADAQTLAPVRTGALKASATTEPAGRVGDTVLKLIGFNTSYAAAVHERLGVRHSQGQAKFLETAMRRSAPKVMQFIADEVKKAIG
jgi:HK97 gp10 family phage protein